LPLPWVSLLATQLVKKKPRSRVPRPEQAIRLEQATELVQYNRM
jgi:hypothetical protein